MCLSSPRGRPGGPGGPGQKRAGKRGFSPTQSLPEPQGSPMTLTSHATSHVMSLLVSCHGPSRCANSAHCPSPPGTADPAASSLSNKNFTTRCYRKAIPCPCGKWPRAVVLRTRSSFRSDSACPCSSSEAGSTSRQSPGRQEVNGQRWRHPTCDFPWLLVSGYPTRSGTGTWGMRADAYIKPTQKRRASGSRPCLPAMRCPRCRLHPGTAPGSSLLRPRPHLPTAIPPLKQGSSPGGRAPL